MVAIIIFPIYWIYLLRYFKNKGIISSDKTERDPLKNVRKILGKWYFTVDVIVPAVLSLTYLYLVL